MRFVAILDGKEARPEHLEIAEKLKAECRKRGLKFVLLDPRKIDWMKLSEIRSYGGKFILYRISPGHLSRSLEFMVFNDSTVTLYNSKEDILIGGADKDIHYSIWEKAGVRIPKTDFFHAPEIPLLKEKVLKLGGFPIIVKVVDSAHGTGVYKADNIRQLSTIVKRLDKKNSRYVFQEYVEDAKRHARLIVLGENVIDSILYTAKKGEFISNKGDNPDVSAKKFSSGIEKLAVRAVKALNMEFGGVDISFGKRGNLILESNFPCNFMRCQNISGINIAGKILDYLIKKSRTSLKRS